MANKLYKIDETAIVFGSEGGELQWTTESLDGTPATGRQSVLHDQGAGGTARAMRWMYRIYCQCIATPTVGQAFRCYLKTSDGTHPDNDDSGDVAVSDEDKLRNLTPLRSPIVDEAALNIEFVSQGIILIPARHFGIVGWNDTGADLTTDVAETKAIFTPIPPELQ